MQPKNEMNSQQIDLGNGIYALISVEENKATVDFRNETTEKGFNWKGFLLAYGFEENGEFRHLLNQYHVSIDYGVDCQCYKLKAEDLEGFLAKVKELLSDYFTPLLNSRTKRKVNEG